MVLPVVVVGVIVRVRMHAVVVVVVTEVVPQDRSGRRSGCDYLAEAHCTSASAEVLYSARKPWWAREGQVESVIASADRR